MDRTEWMKKIDAFYKSTVHVLELEQTWRAPNGWDVRNLYSHLLSWDLEYQRLLEAEVKKGEVNPLVPAYKQQEGYSEKYQMEFLARWNDNQIEKGQTYSLEEIKRQFQRTRQKILKDYESLWVDPDGLIISPTTATHLVDNLSVHDMEHARKFIPPDKISSLEK